jgi:ubiquitin-conjugating enzyme E2 J1
MQDEPF